MGAIPDDRIGLRIAPAPHEVVPPLEPGDRTSIEMERVPVPRSSTARGAARLSPRGEGTAASKIAPALDTAAHTAPDIIESNSAVTATQANEGG